MISKKTIVISIIIIALLVGAYFFMDFVGNDKPSVDVNEGKNESTVSTDSASKLDPVFEADKDKIISVSVTNADESYEFVYDGKRWNAVGNEDVLYDQAYVNSLVLDYVTVTPALLVEENSVDPSKYGFDSPVAESVVKTTDGVTAKFYLGDKTKGGNGYYFMMDGDSNVYTISTVLGNNMLKKLIDYRDKSVLSVEAADIKKIKMSVVGAGDVVLERLDEQLDVTSTWKMTSPFDIGVYDDRITEYILTPLVSVQASEFISDSPTKEQLSESGFDNPQLYYEVTTLNDDIYRVEIGKNFENNYVVKRTDNPTVYLVSSSAFSFLYSDVIDYIHSFAYLPSHEDVTKIECSSENGSFVLSTDKDVYTVNGNKISQKKYSEYYQKLFGVKIQGVVTTPPSDFDDIALSYSISKIDGSSDKIDFINMNGKYAYMSVNGKADFYVFAEDVVKVEDALGELLEYSKNPIDEEKDDTIKEESPSGFNWLALVIAILLILLIASFPVSLLLNSKNKK